MDGVSFGLDDDTIGTNSPAKYFPVLSGGQPFDGSLVAVGTPTTGDTEIDVLYSDDDGSTWNSIVAGSGSPLTGKLIYPQSQVGAVLFSRANFLDIVLQAGWILRIDTLASGGATDIVGRIRWGGYAVYA